MRTTYKLPALALALMAGAAAPRALAAQLKFAPPAAPANVAGYRHVEECLAASARVRDSVHSWGGIWIDTLTAAERRKPQASFAPAREASVRCADNIRRGDEDLADFAPWVALHLLAGRDDRAEALLERRLATVAPGAIAERVGVLDSVAQIALQSSPARLALAERALDQRDQHDSILTSNQVYETPFHLLLQAHTAGDREASVRAAGRLVRLHEGASRETRERASGDLRDHMLFMAHTMLVMDSALTALRTQGTDAFVAIRRESWARATGGLGEGLVIPIGEAAPEIQADVWVGDVQGDAPRPSRGRNSLVVFVPTLCEDRCQRSAPILRRIATRFPELEVTLLASTAGHVHPVVTPTVAEEAKLRGESLLDGHRLPGVLAMEDAKPWYLPDPDGRRVDMPTANEEAYGFGVVRFLTQPFSVFVVDREGTIVEQQQLGHPMTNALAEEILSTIIETLLARQDGAAGGAR